MPDSSTLVVFLAASLALLIIPGPTVMYIVARGLQQGRLAALVSTLGVEVGTAILLLATTLGLSALLASSAPAFSVLKYLGVVYLLCLGISSLRTHGDPVLGDVLVSTSMAPVFLQGVLVQTLNPKTVLFFLAVLPQFTDPARGPVESQMLVLGSLFVALAICSHGLIGLLVGTLGGWLRGNARFLTARRYVCGGVYLSLAAATALAGPGLH